jgi:hypothetical protein
MPNKYRVSKTLVTTTTCHTVVDGENQSSAELDGLIKLAEIPDFDVTFSESVTVELLPCG